MTQDYTVSVSNNFEAESPGDAVKQMIAYLIDHANISGYRVDQYDVSSEPTVRGRAHRGCRQTNTWFIDAEFMEEDGWGTESSCRWCGRRIIFIPDGGTYAWVDPEAGGDDSMWRETCDAHDTFAAEHEPTGKAQEAFEQGLITQDERDEAVLEAYANPVDGDGLGGDA